MTSKTKFSEQKAADFLKSFPSNRISPVYLIFGDELFLKDMVRDILIDHLIPPDKRDFDYSILYGEDTRAEDILEQVEMMPFMAERKVVLIKNADDMKAEQQKRLIPYLENPAPFSVIVFLAEKIDRRQTFYKMLTQNFQSVECARTRNPREFEQWVAEHARLKGVKMDIDTVRFFAGMIDMDLLTAANEFEKLLLYTGNTNRITREDLERVVAALKKTTVYDLQNAVGMKDTKRAVSILGRLIQQGESPVFFTIMLTTFFTTLWRMDALRRRRVPDTRIMEEHMPEVFPFFRKNYFHFLERYDTIQLREVFDILYQTDSDLKSIDVDPGILAEIMIWKICLTGK